ncbi:MAG TPA: adenylate/guanylate cyclase domain-containing protein [Stellaceae bacterium]|nr:adenylate/guanylate cyclase domain-containing protein [Stellaceae bacterium]
MAPGGLSEVGGWVIQAGLAGKSETAMLAEFCRRSGAAGLPLARAAVIIDTLHPVHEGRAFRWRREDGGDAELIEYGPTTDGEAAANWRSSPFFHMLETKASLLRRKLGDSSGFPQLDALAAEGMTEYLALINRFARTGVLGEMDCVYSYWVTDRAGGFSDAEVEQIAGVMPSLALAVKCTSLTRIAGTLVETYLGRDPGRRVLGGRIGRGIAERISAALWYSDLRDFTRIADQVEPHQVIPFLNDYAEVAIAAIHDHGGDVLKLIGDGVLAVFTGGTPEAACRSGMAAEAALRLGLGRLNQRRAFEGLPTTEIYLGLHVGEVFYGNIGSKDRLDFTVVGPAVNEVSRIAAMCRSVDRELLVSEAFAAAMPEPERGRLVSAGRYALRGVDRPQHLFTRDPFAG